MKKDLELINSELRDEAIGCGLCKQWQGEWEKDWDVETLFNRYYRGIDFCFTNDYPSNEFIKESIDKNVLREHGMLVDDTYSFINREMIALLGFSNSTIRVNRRYLCNVWMKDNSSAKIISKGYSGAYIHVFDFCNVEIQAEDFSEIIVFKHSSTCNVTIKNGTGKTKIVEEYGYLNR